MGMLSLQNHHFSGGKPLVLRGMQTHLRMLQIGLASEVALSQLGTLSRQERFAFAAWENPINWRLGTERRSLQKKQSTKTVAVEMEGWSGNIYEVE